MEDIKILRTFLEDRMAVYNEDLDKHLENILNRLEQDERIINKAIEILGEHRHYSSPTEEQALENEDIVNKAYELLKDRKCE